MDSSDSVDVAFADLPPVIDALPLSLAELFQNFILAVVAFVEIQEITGTEFVLGLAGVDVQLLVIQFFNSFESQLLVVESAIVGSRY